MKIFSKISILLLMVISVSACDELDELTEFDITEDFNVTFNVSVEEDIEGMPQTFTESASINIASNADIQSNIDLLQDVTLNSLTYEISNFTGIEGAVVTNASLDLGNTSVSISDINLQQSDNENTVVTIADNAILNAIANDLQTNTEISATVTGTVNDTPVNFDVTLNLDVTVTIDVL